MSVTSIAGGCRPGGKATFGLRNRLRCAASVISLLMAPVLLVPVAGPAAAQQADSELRVYNIPGQPVGAAVVAFGRQSGLQISLAAETASSLRTNAVNGEMNAFSALSSMLSGTGLRWWLSDDGAVIIAEANSGADGTAFDGDGSLVLDTIQVTGRGASRRSAEQDAPFTTPGSDVFISSEQINRVRPTSPGDIFRTAPGVFSAASNDGNSINVNIRGAQGLNRVRTMVEGTQQETTGNRGYAGSDQRTYVDPDLIGGVEISKGPGTGPYGTGSTSGVVNVRLLDAGDLVPEGGTYAIRVRSGISGNAIAPTCGTEITVACANLQKPGTDTGLRSGGDIFSDDNWFGSIAAAHMSENLEIVAAYARRQEGNYFAGDNGEETFSVLDNRGVPDEQRFSNIEPGQEVPNTSEQSQSALLKGTLLFDDGQSLEAGFNYYDSQFGMTFPSFLTTHAPLQTPLNDVQSSRVWLRYNWASENDLIDFNANVWGTRIQELGELGRSGRAPQENESWGAEIWNTSILGTGFGALTMTYGGEYSRSEGLIDVDLPLTRTDYIPGQTPVTTALGSAPDFDGTREVFGGHFNAAISPTDWFTLNAGVRYDRFQGTSTTITGRNNVQFDRDAFIAEKDRLLNAYFDAEDACFALPFPSAAYDACEAAAEAIFDQYENLQETDYQSGFEETVTRRDNGQAERFSPNFGVTLEPLDGLQLFARYSEGFRALSLVELGQSFAFGTTFNPDLEPEVLKTREFGLNYVDNDLLVDDDAFRFKAVYFDNNYENFIARRFLGAPFENFAEVAVAGIETTLSYDMGIVFADLNLAYYTELPSNLGTTVSTLVQPQYSGMLTAGTRWFDERLELGGRLTFFDERQPAIGNELTLADPDRYWPENAIVDIFGSYRLNEKLSASFSVENIRDEYYLPPLFVNRMPAPGRTFRVGLTASASF